MIALKQLKPGISIQNFFTGRIDVVIAIEGDEVVLEHKSDRFTRYLKAVLLNWKIV